MEDYIDKLFLLVLMLAGIALLGRLYLQKVVKASQQLQKTSPDDEDEALIIRLINATLEDAVNASASRIIFEELDTTFLIMFEKGGSREDRAELPTSHLEATFRRLKMIGKIEGQKDVVGEDIDITVKGVPFRTRLESKVRNDKETLTLILSKVEVPGQ